MTFNKVVRGSNPRALSCKKTEEVVSLVFFAEIQNTYKIQYILNITDKHASEDDEKIYTFDKDLNN